jgi:hypothetical protein
MSRPRSRAAAGRRTEGKPGREGTPRPPAEPGAGPFPGASPEARRLAAAILEVLAGTQTPAEAASSLGLSQARYYQVELRAVVGLVAACEGRRRGRGLSPGNDLAALRHECERLRRECARQQALVRATRRSVGLTPEVPETPAEGSRPRQRRPTARALKMAALLRPQENDSPPAGPSAPCQDEAGPADGAGSP